MGGEISLLLIGEESLSQLSDMFFFFLKSYLVKISFVVDMLEVEHFGPKILFLQ